jgi:hypothetical protein
VPGIIFDSGREDQSAAPLCTLTKERTFVGVQQDSIYPAEIEELQMYFKQLGFVFGIG